MDVLFDYVCLSPYAKRWPHTCAITTAGLPERWLQDLDFSMVSLLPVPDRFPLIFFCSITFSYCIDSIYCIVWLEYNACPVIKPIVVCRWQLWVFVVLCLFVCTFLCVCQYILCHLHYYSMLVCLDCTSCARNVYFVCIVCVHWGPLNPDHILMLP